MATQTQTQTLGYSYEDEEEKIPWGRLCPTPSTTEYPVFELIEDVITFGRDSNRCNYELNEPQISGVHTKIIRKNSEADLKRNKLNKSHISDGSCAIIVDHSTNGTFINKRRIGKGKDSMVFDGDEIIFISAAKKDKRTQKERKKVSFLFYKNRELLLNGPNGIDPSSIFAKYDLRTTLGTGSFATVKLGICRETGDQFAIKQIDKKKYEMKSKSRKKNNIMNEANILRQIQHENIIKVYDVFDENNILYIVLEMANGGELFSRIIEKKKLNENISRYIMKQLLNAIMYLHDNKIAHRDLKPENILMKDKQSWDIKITDFGLSRLLEYDYEIFTTMCGTPLFLAPEVLTSKKRGGYGYEVDYWSIGVILYLMLVGHPPYNEKDGNLLELVKEGKYSYPKQTWSKISPSAKHLVEHLMEVDVNKRYGGKQVLEHPWMNGQCYLNNNNDDKLTGKKRKLLIDDDIKDNDDINHSIIQPARKKYKNYLGNAQNTSITHKMSMDSFETSNQNLTPFDSIIEKNEPKKKINHDINQQNGDSEKHNNDPNGNGASNILKNSISLKEMSLD